VWGSKKLKKNSPKKTEKKPQTNFLRARDARAPVSTECQRYKLQKKKQDRLFPVFLPFSDR